MIFASLAKTKLQDIEIEKALSLVRVGVADMKRAAIESQEASARAWTMLERNALEAAALKREIERLTACEREAFVRAEGIRRDIDLVYADERDLAEARGEGERAADARYMAAAAGNPTLETFVEQHRVRGLERLVQRFGRKAV